jgi:hypothetical protein
LAAGFAQERLPPVHGGGSLAGNDSSTARSTTAASRFARRSARRKKGDHLPLEDAMFDVEP